MNTAHHPLLQEWQRLTREGLEAHRAHCVVHALVWHQRALQVAHQLMELPADVADDDRLAAFVVAHLNLADCHADMNQPAAAADCVGCAHRRLLALLHDEAQPPTLRQAAARHLRETLAALLPPCQSRTLH